MKTDYTDADFAKPLAACDVIMKGGITSGVVYPLAITELAKRFRFASVGGTSAGAIAAAVAAAAEYGRQVPGKGFVRLARVPEDIGERLFSFFQPSPQLKPLFNLFVAAMSSKGAMATTANVARAAIAGFPLAAIGGVLPGTIIAILGCWFANFALILLGVLLALIGLIGCVGLAIYRAATAGIPANDFGICPGKTQPGNPNPGLTDWLADLIDDTAGRDPKQKHPPLTFGDLSGAPGSGKPKIDLRMVTTNLTLRRPYSLPLSAGGYAFKLADFRRLFPDRIVDYLAANCERAEQPGEHDDLFKFPATEKLPLVVAARMSLSFPLLFCAVPLYARDFTLRGSENEIWRKNLFSDGGLSSNFPIHFFDRLLPSSPTFAISLDEYDERRQPEGAPPPEDPRSRVWLPDPKSASSGLLIPGHPFSGLLAFLMRLVDSAKDWQDNLQSTLAGYRDRIIHVNLKSEEGGLNIAMPPGMVLTLADYGAVAGQTLRDDFNLDEHRWRRFLVAMTRLDETLGEFADAYEGHGVEPFAAFLARYSTNPPDSPLTPLSYKQTARDLQTLLQRARELSALGRSWRSQHEIPERSLPHPKTDMRITPRL